MNPTQPATVSQTFDAAVLEGADRDFIHVPATATGRYAPNAITLTYRQAATRVAALRESYRAAGYGGAFRVGLAFDNRPEFFLHLLALNSVGASVVPLNAAMTHDELRFVLTHSDTALVVCHDGHEQHLLRCLPADCVLSAGASLTALPPPRRPPLATPEEVALVYTSGTTGRPKGCILDEAYFRQAGTHYLSINGYCAFHHGEDRLITPLPVTHMNALACSFMAMIMTGGCLVQLDRFHPSTWWDSVRASRATCFHYLGVMPAMLLSAAADPADDFSKQLRFGFGAGVDPRHHIRFEHRFGVALIEAWAMTETGGAAWITASHEPRHVGERCFGRAPEGLDWRIVADTGRDADRGAPGELLVRRSGSEWRAGFFAGYYKDPDATTVAWADGWFHTGDIVRVGPDGSFFFVDRLKNIIRRSGENIAAVEVESILLQVPGILACAVTAVADEVRGEEVFAFLIGTDPAAADRSLADRAQAACLRDLVYFKAPGYVAFVDRLPQTASQKLSRAEVKSAAAAAVKSGRAFDLRSGKKSSA